MSDQWFAPAETQASKLTHALNEKGSISSVGTFRNFEQSLKTAAQNFKDAKLPSINNITSELAVQYLSERALEVGQKQLDLDRQALQCVMQHYNHNLQTTETLPVIKSEHQQILKSRAYTKEQVKEVAAHQQSHNALSTELAHACGLRAHELLTIQPVAERTADPRPSHENKFEGRAGLSYTVVGKGGLVREICVPSSLAERLEAHRLTEPQKITDRDVHYERSYSVGGGNAWSASFSRSSTRAFEWSNGAHGVRHSYAQERMSELQRNHPYQEALRIVSQEMGHFRPSVTEIYLR